VADRLESTAPRPLWQILPLETGGYAASALRDVSSQRAGSSSSSGGTPQAADTVPELLPER
jgi:hypothetical protein